MNQFTLKSPWHDTLEERHRNGPLDISESDYTQAYGLARDYANRRFTRAEADVLIRAYVPAIAHRDLTRVLEHAFSHPQPMHHPTLTDRGLARYCLQRLNGRIKVRADDHAFLYWNDRYWEWVHGQARVEEQVKKTLDELLDRLPINERPRFQRWLDSLRNLRAVIEAIRFEAERVSEDQLTCHKDLLLLNNGVYSISQGQMVSLTRQDHVTDALHCHASYHEDSRSAVWCAFIEELCRGNQEMQLFLQMMSGYLLCAETNELDTLFVIQGDNGGSLFLDVIAFVMGSYVGILPSEVLDPRFQSWPDLSLLKDQRVLLIPNVNRDRPVDLHRLRALAQGQRFTAFNKKQQCWVDCSLTGKLVIEPHQVTAWTKTPDKIARHILVISFGETGLQEDRLNRFRTLTREADGILAWMLQGYDRFIRADRILTRPDGMS